MMSPELLSAVMVLLRYTLAGGFASLVSKGLVHQGDVDTLAGAGTTVIVGVVGWGATLAWGLYRSRKAAKIADVANMKDVSSVHAEPATAAAMQAQGVANVIASPPAAP